MFNCGGGDCESGLTMPTIHYFVLDWFGESCSYVFLSLYQKTGYVKDFVNFFSVRHTIHYPTLL